MLTYARPDLSVPMELTEPGDGAPVSGFGRGVGIMPVVGPIVLVIESGTKLSRGTLSIPAGGGDGAMKGFLLPSASVKVAIAISAVKV